MGHIMLITENIQALMDRDLSEDLKTSFQQYTQTDEWQDFVTRPYREARDVASRVLGGQKAALLDMHSDQAEQFSPHVDLNTDQLARYMIRQVMSDLPEQFATDDNDADEGGWAYVTYEYLVFICVVKMGIPCLSCKWDRLMM